MTLLSLGHSIIWLSDRKHELKISKHVYTESEKCSVHKVRLSRIHSLGAYVSKIETFVFLYCCLLILPPLPLPTTLLLLEAILVYDCPLSEVGTLKAHQELHFDVGCELSMTPLSFSQSPLPIPVTCPQPQGSAPPLSLGGLSRIQIHAEDQSEMAGSCPRVSTPVEMLPEAWEHWSYGPCFPFHWNRV